MPAASRNKPQKIQNATIRVAMHWSIKISTVEMHKRAHLTPLYERAIALSNNYIAKAYAVNTMIRKQLDDYALAS